MGTSRNPNSTPTPAPNSNANSTPNSTVAPNPNSVRQLENSSSQQVLAQLNSMLCWADQRLDDFLQLQPFSADSPVLCNPLRGSALSFQLKVHELKIETVKLEMDGREPADMIGSRALRSKLAEARIKLRFFVEAAARVRW